MTTNSPNRFHRFGFIGYWIAMATGAVSLVILGTSQPPRPPASYSQDVDALLIVMEACGLVIACGAALRLAYRAAKRDPDRFARLAWTTALGLLLTLAVVWCLLLLTIGMIAEAYSPLLILILISGAPIGWTYGAMSQRRRG